MNKIKTAHLVAYNSHQIDSLITQIEALHLKLEQIKSKSLGDRINDFIFCIVDERAYLENSIVQLQSSLYRHKDVINFLQYYVKEEFVDVSDIPNFYAPDFYKFCTENKLTY